MKHIKKYNEAVDTDAAQAQVFLSGCENGWTVAVKKLLDHQNFSEETLQYGLAGAVRRNQLDIIKYLVEEKGVDPTVPQIGQAYDSLLSVAVANYSYRTIDYFLDFEGFNVNADNALLFQVLIMKLNDTSQMDEQTMIQRIIEKAFRHPTASPMNIVRGFYTDKGRAFRYLPYLQDFNPRIMNAIKTQDKFDLF